MRNADGEVPGQTRCPALQAVRMNELDTLELDEESQEGFSSVRMSTHLVPPSPPIKLGPGAVNLKPDQSTSDLLRDQIAYASLPGRP
jgi:hypothetical protein